MKIHFARPLFLGACLVFAPHGRKWFSYRREQDAPERGTPAAQPLDFDAQNRVVCGTPTNAVALTP